MISRTVVLLFLSISLFAQHRAKNIILFLGDAGGIPTLNAASIHGYKEPRALYIQRMPHIALSETSSTDSWVTDSPRRDDRHCHRPQDRPDSDKSEPRLHVLFVSVVALL
jgi:hypothetical protein